MAIVIMLTKDSEPVTDAEVAAFIDGECRGTTFADEGLYYLLVAGEGSGQPIEIKANIDGTVKTICTSLTYASDASIGTPWDPFVIEIGTITGIRVVSGLPADTDTDWWTLQGFKIGRRPTQPGVYIHRGEKVIIKEKK